MNACLACPQVKDPRKMKFPLKSVESSEFNEVVQIDHQKICMTESGYNQILVIIDHFTKLAEAVPCQTASAEETCDNVITHWISRYGCPMTFQSDNGKQPIRSVVISRYKKNTEGRYHRHNRMDWSTAQRVRRDCFHDAAWMEYFTQPRVPEGAVHLIIRKPAAGADPDSITLANEDLKFRWSCDATDVGNT